jgi:HPt (histidine-containing phosphotransfer) domain-containing protein
VSARPDECTPVVDVAGGTARLMGDGALFARVLARFRKDYRDTAGAIRSALDGGDLRLALRLVHTLKGAAGMIEAVPLYRSAEALEQAVRAGGDPYARTAHLAHLDTALDAVLRALDDHALQLAPAPPRTPPAPSPAHRDARMRLRVLLDEGNGEAVDLVREAEATLRTEMGNENYERLAEAIDAFDFNDALTLLKALPDVPPTR